MRMLFVFVGALQPINTATHVVSESEGPHVDHSGMMSSLGSTITVIPSAVAATSSLGELSGLGGKGDLEWVALSIINLGIVADAG